MFLYPVLIGEFDVHAWHDTPRQTQNPADVFAKFFLFIFNPLLALLRYNVLYLCVLAIEHCQCTSYSLCATFRVDVCCVVFKSPIGAALSFTGIYVHLLSALLIPARLADLLDFWYLNQLSTDVHAPRASGRTRACAR